MPEENPARRLAEIKHRESDDAEFVEHAREDVRWLLSYVRDLETELAARDYKASKKAAKKWAKQQVDQLSLRYAEFRAGRWEMDLGMAREMAAAYVAMAKAMLGDAPNYTETKLYFDVKIAESPEVYTLVVQRNAPGALTPHEARQKAESELKELRVGWRRVREALICGLPASDVLDLMDRRDRDYTAALADERARADAATRTSQES